MIETIFDKILQKLNPESYFSVFAFRKRDNCLIKKTSSGFEAIELQYWKGFDLSRNEVALVIKPLYLKRFDVLHRWFEKFSFKSLSDQRDKYSIGFDGKMLGNINDFYFLVSGADFEKDLDGFKKGLVANSKNVFDKYSSISDLYDYYIDPFLNKGEKLPNVGADWIFEYLTIVKLIKDEYFDDVKIILEEQASRMNDKGEPNIIEYYSKFNEIVNYLRKQKLE